MSLRDILEPKLRPYLPRMKWGAALTGVTGALLIASNISISGWAFAVYVVSSSLWCLSAWIMRERSLMFETAIYTVINILGIVRWLF